MIKKWLKFLIELLKGRTRIVFRVELDRRRTIEFNTKKENKMSITNDMYDLKEALKSTCVNAVLDELSTGSMEEYGFKLEQEAMRKMHSAVISAIQSQIESQVSAAIERMTR
jgi:hypothetical protein